MMKFIGWNNKKIAGGQRKIKIQTRVIALGKRGVKLKKKQNKNTICGCLNVVI